MASDKSTDTGLFIVSYNVSTGMAGAPNLQLDLHVNTTNQQVGGGGSVTQATYPPHPVTAQMGGSYKEYSDVNGPNYVVSLDGYTPVVINGDTRPIIEAGLILEGGWESGTGSFSFRRGVGGPMTHITGAKVTKTK